MLKISNLTLFAIASFISLFLIAQASSETRSENQIIVADRIKSKTQELVIKAGEQYATGLADTYERLAKEAYSNFGKLNGLPATDLDRAKLQSFFSQKSKYYRQLSKSSKSVSKFVSQNAKKISLVADVGLAVFDEYMLRNELDDIRENLPGLDVKDIRFTDVRGIGSSIANGLSFGLFRVVGTSYEAFDEMPQDPRKLPAWIAVMEEISNSVEGDEYATYSPPPLGFLQYLKAKQVALNQVRGEYGLSAFSEKYSWINKWRVSDTPGFGTIRSVVSADDSWNIHMPIVGDNGDLTDDEKISLPQEPTATSEHWVGGVTALDQSPASIHSVTTGGDIETEDNGLGTETIDVYDPNTNGITAAVTGTVQGNYSYSSWGEWNGSITINNGGTGQNTTFSRGLFVMGQPTPRIHVDQRRGEATYSGSLLGDYASQSTGVIANSVNGSVNLTANFTNRTMTGNLNMSGPNGFSANTTANAGFYDRGGNAGYGGNLTGPNGNGGIGGTFFGPTAQETGGTFWFFTNTGENATGVFRAQD